jgi:hypothetical protein
LTKADLSEANLSAADLVQADLRGANLRRANLSGAILIQADLDGADLAGADLTEANLCLSYLPGANLSGADLTGADLGTTDLSGADLTGADLGSADLSGADLTGADLSEADLRLANLREAKLGAADLTWAVLRETIFGDVDLTETKGLNECEHLGPSIIDFRTLSRSENLPISFLRGCGLPDNLIDYLPSLRGEGTQFYSCFISYSAKDQAFVDGLHADLQNKGVRCWFAPHDLPIGAPTRETIYKAIAHQDKLLLILSKASIGSRWVEYEVEKAYAEEGSRKETILFPIRIDNTVISTEKAWAVTLREQRHIGDFRQWKKPAEYQKSLDRLLSARYERGREGAALRDRGGAGIRARHHGPERRQKFCLWTPKR